MTVQTSWLLKNHILYYEAYGELTAEDLSSAARTSQKLLTHSTFREIHLLMNFQGVTQLPKNMKQVLASDFLLPQLRGWRVACHCGCCPQYAHFMLSTMAQMLHVRARVLPTLTDALQFLGQMDDRLPNLLQLAQGKLPYESW